MPRIGGRLAPTVAPSPVVCLALIQTMPVDVIRHRDELSVVRITTTSRGTRPYPTKDLLNSSVKRAFPPVRTYRDEICSRLRVVV